MIEEKEMINMLTEKAFSMPILDHENWTMMVTAIGNISGEPLVYTANSKEHTLGDVFMRMEIVQDLCNQDGKAHFILFEDSDTKEQFMTLRIPRTTKIRERRNMIYYTQRYIRSKFGIQVTSMHVV